MNDVVNQAVLWVRRTWPLEELGSQDVAIFSEWVESRDWLLRIYPKEFKRLAVKFAIWFYITQHLPRVVILGKQLRLNEVVLHPPMCSSSFLAETHDLSGVFGHHVPSDQDTLCVISAASYEEQREATGAARSWAKCVIIVSDFEPEE